MVFICNLITFTFYLFHTEYTVNFYTAIIYYFPLNPISLIKNIFILFLTLNS